MKKAGIILFTLMLALTALAQDLQLLVTVTGDRVSLRAAPELNAVLLDRAMKGDQLLLADNSNPEWIGVRPPLKIDSWVNAEFIRDDIVLPSRLNVRSGPSLSHGVLAVVSRGEELTVRGTLDGWIRIAPPKEAIVWISRAYTDMSPVEPPKEPVKPIIVESPKPDVPETEKVVVQQVLNELVMSTSDVPGLPEVLEADPEKEQGVEEQFSGILQPANDVLYKLVDPKFKSIVICYVRGNSEQMKAYAGRSLTLAGRAYWATGVNMPVIRPATINVLSEAPVE